MRKVLALAVMVLLMAGACMAGNAASVDEDCPCLGAASPISGNPELLLERNFGEQMEWVCETYRRVVCTDYDSEPCAWCVIPCGAACGFCAALGDPAAIGACYAVCVAACAAGCPECDYCVRYEIEETVVCGWVLVE